MIIEQPVCASLVSLDDLPDLARLGKDDPQIALIPGYIAISEQRF